MKKITKMGSDHYRLIASIIREIPDEKHRKVAADHFATAFNRRSKAFDPMAWERACGGKVAPNSAA